MIAKDSSQQTCLKSKSTASTEPEMMNSDAVIDIEPMTQITEEEEEEEYGQELLWIEDQEQPHDVQEFLYVDNVDPVTTQTSSSSSRRKKKTKKLFQRFFFSKKAAIQSPRVAVVDSTTPTQHDLARQKAAHARQLLEEALSSEDSSDENDDRIQFAFDEALDARRMVSSTEEEEEDENMWKIQQKLGQEEAQQAVKNKKKNANNTPTSIIQAAEQHAEQARIYLESMLPEFLNHAVSSNSSGEVAASPPTKQQQPPPPAKTKKSTRQQTPRQREELIARVVQENQTQAASPAISTLGFDNTFDTKSLGDIMDNPSTPQSKETLSKLLKKKQQQKQQQQKQQIAAAAASSQPLTSPARRLRIQKFVATVGPAEAEVPLTEADKMKLEEIQQLDQLVDGRLAKAAAAEDDDDACSLSSYHGVPLHDAKEKRSGKMMENKPTTFVQSTSFRPELLDAKSWEDLADGNASLEEVVEQHKAHRDPPPPKPVEKKKKKFIPKLQNEENTPDNTTTKEKKKKKSSWLRLKSRRSTKSNPNQTKKTTNASKTKTIKPSTTTITKKPKKKRVTTTPAAPNDLPRTISISPDPVMNSPPTRSSPPPLKMMSTPPDEDRYISLQQQLEEEEESYEEQKIVLAEEDEKSRSVSLLDKYEAPEMSP